MYNLEQRIGKAEKVKSEKMKKQRSESANCRKDSTENKPESNGSSEENMRRNADIVIVGGGAGGLMAAYGAAVIGSPSQKEILLVEGNSRIGKKLLATGNGRCNLSNEGLHPAAYDGPRQVMEQLLTVFDSHRLRALFAKMGLSCVSDESGRIYPRNFQAAAVLQCLQGACEEKGVRFLCDCNVHTVAPQDQGGFLLTTDAGEIYGKKLILSCGGMASPKHSARTNGYDLARSLGHEITPLVPALVPLNCQEKWVKSLKGQRCKARVQLMLSGREKAAEQGEVIFNRDGLSGICVFDLSGTLAALEKQGRLPKPYGKEVQLVLDLLPDLSEDTVLTHLRALQRNRPELPSLDLLSGLINLRVGETILRRLLRDPELPIRGLTQQLLRKIVQTVKGFTFHFQGFGSWEQAQVTMGGVCLSHWDPKTMGSKKQKGLYLSGEVLDVTGKCGGYNLHFAFATGYLAGTHAAKGLT